MSYYYQRDVDPEVIQKALGCQPGMMYVASLPPIPGGRFSLKTWWAKDWLAIVEANYDLDTLTDMRADARKQSFHGLCIAPEGLRAWYSEYEYYPMRYGQVVELPLPQWNADQQAAIMDILRQRPIDAALLIQGEFPLGLYDVLLSNGIDLFVDWLKGYRYTTSSYYDGVLAFVLSKIIEKTPLFLFALHGLAAENVWTLFDEASLGATQSTQSTKTENVWLGHPFPVMAAFRRRRPFLRDHVERLPFAKDKVKAVVAKASQIARKHQSEFEPPTWEAAPLYDGIITMPPMPEIPPALQERFEAIAQISDDFCTHHIPVERDRDMLAAFARRIIALSLIDDAQETMKRGYPKTWACAALYLLGTINPGAFSVDFMCDVLGVSANTTPGRAAQIRKALDIAPDDLRWMTPASRENDFRLRLWRDASGMISVRD